MDVQDTKLPGVLVINSRRFGDHRGFFAETYSRRDFAEAGIDVEFVQDNHSLSLASGTVRGLHFQDPPFAQAKLVRCGRGAIFDVAVDIRQNSPNFGHWVGYELTAENGMQLYIPRGFAHGFATLEDQSEIVYKCSQYYAPQSERTLRWDDPAIGITWPVQGRAILNSKDANAPMLADFDCLFRYEE